jgi:hypothetical protein
MSINWLVLAPADEDLRIPTYGKYGGPDYSGGKLLRSGDVPDFTVKPINDLDRLFRRHDIDVREAESSYGQALADLRLIKGILKLSPAAVSGEGDLYAGAAILAAIGRIIVSDRHPEVLARIDLPRTIDKAIDLIEQGSIRPDAREIAGFREWLKDTGSELASRHQPTLDLAADKLRDLADTLHGANARKFHFTLDGDAFTFTAGEAKSFLAHTAQDLAATWDTDVSGSLATADQVPAAVLHQVETLAHKIDLPLGHWDSLF